MSNTSLILLTILPLLLSPLRAQGLDVGRNAGLQPDGPGRLCGIGEHYLARFSVEGMQFVPALGAATEQVRHVSLRPVAVQRGARAIAGPFATEPARSDLSVIYSHEPGLVERYDVGIDGVEVSWRIAHRPIGDGDLVVRYAVDTNLPASSDEAGAMRFVQPDLGGVSIGGVTGVDANGWTVTGELRRLGSSLEMALPAAFVEGATYPIVLDPLIGPVRNVMISPSDDSEPDVAFDHTTGNYLIAWSRTFSSTLAVPRAQRVDTSGSLVGNTIVLSATGVCGRPRVANFPARDRFGVVFEETAGLANGIQFRAIDASTGAITHLAVLATSTGVDLFEDPDIGADVFAPQASTRAFTIVYRDNIQNEVRARRVYFDATDALVSPTAVTVFADTGGVFSSSYTQPAMSRQAGLQSRYMVVARRYSGTGPSLSISARLISSTTLATIATTSMDTTVSDSLEAPDVDGADGTYVMAWQRTAPGANDSIRRRSVAYDDAAGWSLGTVETLGGTTLTATSAPTLGWAPGRTWLGYRNFSGIGPQVSLRAAAIDSASSTWGGDVFARTISSPDTRIVVATAMSGGVSSGEDALAVFAHGTDVFAQQLINYGTSGTFLSLGGQCGAAGGTQYFSHAPGIGSSALVCGVVGLSPNAVLSVFNLAPPGTPLACGSCEWTPFSVTDVRFPIGGTVATGFPIPCLPALVGSQFETQWTTFDPSQSPCPVFAGVVLSDRSLMTIGN